MSPPPTLLTLPPAVLARILRLTLGIPPDGILSANPDSLRQLVLLSRTSNALRIATRHAITALHLPDTSVWPNLKIISTTAWPTLTSVHLNIHRTCLIALITWLSPASALTSFTLRVTGPPHDDPRFAHLERARLVKLFTAVGQNLHTLDVRGVDNHALLISSLFHCTSLKHLSFGPASNVDSPRTLTYLTVLLALVNKPHLTHLASPLHEWRAALDEPLSAPSVAAACKITWDILWPSFTAGLKESAANTPSDESNEMSIVSNFRTMLARFEALNNIMQAHLESLRDTASKLGSDDVPLSLLHHLLPNLGRTPADDCIPLVDSKSS